jgi:hypothetical protein
MLKTQAKSGKNYCLRSKTHMFLLIMEFTPPQMLNRFAEKMFAVEVKLLVKVKDEPNQII